jgi:transcriptional regulator with XRE-family HTH domain
MVSFVLANAVRGGMASRPSIYRHVARRLVQLRRDKGWRQEDLVRETSLGESQLSKIETGVQNLHLHRIVEIADALEVPLAEFFVGYQTRRVATGAHESARTYGAHDDRSRLTELVAKLGPNDLQVLVAMAERLTAARRP